MKEAESGQQQIAQLSAINGWLFRPERSFELAVCPQSGAITRNYAQEGDSCLYIILCQEDSMEKTAAALLDESQNHIGIAQVATLVQLRHTAAKLAQEEGRITAGYKKTGWFCSRVSVKLETR